MANSPILKITMTEATEYFVYILRTSLNTLYIGQTNNLERRLKEHQSKSAKSAKYVRCFDSVELVYVENQKTRGDALRREHELRKLTKIKKEELVAKKAGTQSTGLIFEIFISLNGVACRSFPDLADQ